MILAKKTKIFFVTILVLFIYIFSLFNISEVFAEVTYEPEDFSVLSQSAYLVNNDNGQVLYKKNEREKLPPASLTKIMTAIIVLETLPAEDLEKSIPCYNDIMTDSYWYEQGASMSGFYPDEVISIKNMIYALLIQSACDMGDVLAKYTATTYMNGDINTFIDKMNEKAKELGANDTHFVNTHGLDAEGQYTTAYDMYLITKHALSIPNFLEFTDTDVYYIAPTNVHSEKFPLINTNEMIFSSSDYYYEPIIPIKTGTTGQNTQNLITLAEQNGYTYMGIVLGGKYATETGQRAYETYKDTKNLYEWAFNDFSLRTIVKKGDTSSGVEIGVRLSTAYDYVIGVPEKTVEEIIPDTLDVDQIKRVANVPEKIDAPIKEGQILGTMDLMIGNDVLTSVNIISTKDIERSTILYIFDEIRKIFSTTIAKVIGIVLLLFIICYVLYLVDKNNKRKKKMRTRNDSYRRNKPTYKQEYYKPKDFNK